MHQQDEYFLRPKIGNNDLKDSFNLPPKFAIDTNFAHRIDRREEFFVRSERLRAGMVGGIGGLTAPPEGSGRGRDGTEGTFAGKVADEGDRERQEGGRGDNWCL